MMEQLDFAKPIPYETKIVQGFDNPALYYINMVTSVIFVLSHLILMVTIFNFWGNGDYLVLIYSSLQLIVGSYSLVLTFGEVALQIVFLSAKEIIRWILFIVLAIGTTMLAITAFIYLGD